MNNFFNNFNKFENKNSGNFRGTATISGINFSISSQQQQYMFEHHQRQSVQNVFDVENNRNCNVNMRTLNQSQNLFNSDNNSNRHANNVRSMNQQEKIDIEMVEIDLHPTYENISPALPSTSSTIIDSNGIIDSSMISSTMCSNVFNNFISDLTPLQRYLL